MPLKHVVRAGVRSLPLLLLTVNLCVDRSILVGKHPWPVICITFYKLPLLYFASGCYSPD